MLCERAIFFITGRRGNRIRTNAPGFIAVPGEPLRVINSVSAKRPTPGYARHKPETTLLYQLVERYYPELAAVREAAGRALPQYVREEFEAYLKCGRLEHGFLRVRCEDCHAEKLVAFSCKRRGFCPSCGARRMTDSAALLADEVLPAKPIRQWVLSCRTPTC